MIAEWKSFKTRPPENIPLIVTTSVGTLICPVLYLKNPYTGGESIFEWSSDFREMFPTAHKVIAWDEAPMPYNNKYKGEEE